MKLGAVATLLLQYGFLGGLLMSVVFITGFLTNRHSWSNFISFGALFLLFRLMRRKFPALVSDEPLARVRAIPNRRARPIVCAIFLWLCLSLYLIIFSEMANGPQLLAHAALFLVLLLAVNWLELSVAGNSPHAQAGRDASING